MIGRPPLRRPWARWRRDTSWLFDLGAEFYSWFTNQPVWRGSCASMASRLPAGGAPLVADLGCGPGVSAIEMARLRPEARIFGLDVAPRMLREARRRLRAARVPTGRVRLVLGTATRLPFPSDSYDALTGHSFLYLVPDRQAVLAECLRVLRPGGRLVLMEPNERPARLDVVLRLARDPRHLVSVGLWRPFSRFHGRFTPDSLASALTSAGFADCRVEETLGGLGLLASADRPRSPAADPRSARP